MTDGNDRPLSYLADSTEPYPQFVARLRADLAALTSEQSLPLTPERRDLVAKRIELIERELEKLGEKPGR